MTSSNSFRPAALIHFALKIRQIADNSWWVYRHEIGRNGTLSITSRVVFFGHSREDADLWIDRQREEATIYMLSEN